LFVFQCSCGCVFDCDAGTEENCFWIERSHCNVPQCPRCAKAEVVLPFSAGDRVAYTEHAWVRWDKEPEVEDEITVTNGRAWPIRLLGAVEALAELGAEDCNSVEGRR
jgi:hypothetical protein